MNANHQKTSGGFSRFAELSAHLMGRPWAFITAMVLIVLWGATGPWFHFSDTWQLIVNTATTVVTFLMVFLIQNTQNRDARAIHLKLDELIRSIKRAHNEMINIETLSDQELEHLAERYEQIRQRWEDRRSRHDQPAA